MQRPLTCRSPHRVQRRPSFLSVRHSIEARGVQAGERPRWDKTVTVMSYKRWMSLVSAEPTGFR